MIELSNIFQTIFDFCRDIMTMNLNLFGMNINLLSVFMFALIGSIMWKAIVHIYNND